MFYFTVHQQLGPVHSLPCCQLHGPVYFKARNPGNKLSGSESCTLFNCLIIVQRLRKGKKKRRKNRFLFILGNQTEDNKLFKICKPIMENKFVFLDMQEGKPWVLRLLVISCLSLAAKMKNTPFSLSGFLVISPPSCFFLFLFFFLHNFMDYNCKIIGSECLGLTKLIIGTYIYQSLNNETERGRSYL